MAMANFPVEELSSCNQQSKAALVRFMDRLAENFAQSLHRFGVEFHTVADNGRSLGLGEDGFDKCAQLKFWVTPDGVWRFAASDSLLDWNVGTEIGRVPSVTIITRSELEAISDMWAGVVAKQSKQVVFADLYSPSAVLESVRFRNPFVAFRHVRAWDPMNSRMIVRFDTIFKDLSV